MSVSSKLKTAGKVIGRSGYYLTIGVLTKRREAREYLQTMTDAALDFHPANRRLPPLTEIDVIELLPEMEGREIPVRLSRRTKAELPVRDLVHLNAIVTAVQPTTVFEFGTNRGRTARLIAERTSPDARIYTLDLPPTEVMRRFHVDSITAERVGEVFRGHPVSEKITQLFYDSRTFDYRPYEGRMKLVFVDADHSYEGVMNDTMHALRLVAPGGWIIWDDYHPAWPGVMRCLEELAQRRKVVHLRESRLACCHVT